MFALGLMSWLYHRPTEGTIAFLEKKFASKPAIAEANVKAFKAGWAYGETSEDFVVSYEVAPAPMEPGTLPQHHRQPGARDRPDRGEREERAAALPRCLPDHARLGDPRAPVAPQALRRPHLPGRGRDRGRRRGDRRELRRRARRLHLERPRRRAQGRDRRPRGRARAAAADPRHPARRAIDRDADQARAGRPADGALRPQRRVACARGRGLDAGRLLRRGARGGAHRAQVPHARLPALRRLPRQRLGAVAAARRRRAPGDPGRVRDRAEPRRRVPAVRARPRDARARVGNSRARPGSSTGSAAWRSRTRPATSRYDPDNHDRMVRLRAREGREHRRGHSRARGRRPGRRVAAGAGLGRHLRPDHRGRATAAQGGQAGRAGAPDAPEPVPAQHSATSFAPTTGCSFRR